MDPSRRKTGGALLGDRIRMNSINHPNITMRSLATRDAGSEIAACLPDVIAACKCAGFDLVLVETSGIGQGDAAIVPHVDFSLYVMTPEFGAASQLEKIDMLDFADFVAINKFDRRGAQDALRDVRKQMQRNRGDFTVATDAMPVFGTIASRFNDDGVTALYQSIVAELKAHGLKAADGRLKPTSVKSSSGQNVIVPPARVRYLAEIAETVRGYHADVGRQTKTARERQQLREARRMLDAAKKSSSDLDPLIEQRDKALSAQAKALLEEWPQIRQSYSGDEQITKVRDREIRTTLTTTSLSGTKRGRRRNAQMADAGKPAGLFSLHRGRVCVQARERRPDPHVRRRRRSVPHQRALQIPVPGHAGQAPVDRVRLGDALWIRSARTPGYLRQSRQFRSVDRNAGRYEGLVFRIRLVRPGDFGIDDHQRPGADHPGDVHQHGDRPADRQIRGTAWPATERAGNREDPRLGAGKRAWHRAGRHPQGRPGAEHLHLLHGVFAEGHGRHPGILRAEQGA